MKKLPKVQVTDAAQADKRALAAWLAEWSLDRRLAEATSLRKEERPTWSGTPPTEGAPPPEPLVCGQVRLLWPSSPPTRERPRYVAVLETFADGSFQIAPFSRFSVPATPGELATGESALPVKVLCLWNARRMPASVASASWYVGDLVRAVLEDAAAVQRHLAEGTRATGRLAARTGPPLRHPLDPRWEYLDEERTWMDEVAGAETATRTPLRYERPQPTDLLKAAEDKAKYTTRSESGEKREPSDMPHDPALPAEDTDES